MSQRKNRPYASLRIMSGLIQFMGWIVIWIMLVSVLFWYTASNSRFQEDPTNPNTFGLMMMALRVIPWPWVFTAVTMGIIVGMLIIATGQIYAVFLDIRDDTHEILMLTEDSKP